ncbi:MAG: SRPBCC family protein [Methylococcales bacterium]|nr:SRPBCC family protein [Methylococcales bacterium]
MKQTLVLLCAFLTFPLSAFAHGPTPQKGLDSITINAPVEAVWDMVKQFDAIATWHPDVKASKGDGKNASDGIRTVTLQGGDIVEMLDHYSEQDHEYNYRLKTENPQALPISSHSTSLQVTAGDEANTAVVTFKSRFYRADTGNTPSATQNDEAAVNAMTAFFKNGLVGLKNKMEK